jgi:hypothetical protein
VGAPYFSASRRAFFPQVESEECLLRCLCPFARPCVSAPVSLHVSCRNVHVRCTDVPPITCRSTTVVSIALSVTKPASFGNFECVFFPCSRKMSTYRPPTPVLKITCVRATELLSWNNCRLTSLRILSVGFWMCVCSRELCIPVSSTNHNRTNSDVEIYDVTIRHSFAVPSQSTLTAHHAHQTPNSRLRNGKSPRLWRLTSPEI